MERARERPAADSTGARRRDAVSQDLAPIDFSRASKIPGGVPADSIVACAEDQGADLIVMGTHGRRGWSRLRFGSVAEAVLRQAPCSVLTVKTPKFEPGHRRVLPQAVE